MRVRQALGGCLLVGLAGLVPSLAQVPRSSPAQDAELARAAVVWQRVLGPQRQLRAQAHARCAALMHQGAKATRPASKNNEWLTSQIKPHLQWAGGMLGSFAALKAILDREAERVRQDWDQELARSGKSAAQWLQRQDQECIRLIDESQMLWVDGARRSPPTQAPTGR